MNDDSPLNAALRKFEAVEANLLKLEKLWSEDIRPQMPSGLEFYSDTPEYDRACKQFGLLLAALPAIDGWKPSALPMALNDIGRNRFDFKELGEPIDEIAFDASLEDPIREIREYRFRYDQARRKLIRDTLIEKIDSIDERLRALDIELRPQPGSNGSVSGSTWEALREDVAQIHTLLGSSTPRPERWSDLQRHLHFAMAGDLYDIVHNDWPDVKAGLRKSLYGENEPIPVEVADLGELVATKPKGNVATKLHWNSLSDEDFERLIFQLISSEPGYVNAQWLTKTNAADHGRDLSVTRVQVDSLTGTMSSRVVIQCKHWLSKSITPAEVASLLSKLSLWEPPRIDVVIIATSGRFTSDAVGVIEKHNQSDRALRIEMWPESHLENVLAKRPAMIGQFKLR